MSNWKDIEGYNGLFQVSDCGQVRQTVNVHKGRKAGIVKQYTVSAGYLQVQLSKSYKYVHRLVAQAFIHNHHNLPTVNHKDLNKTNNHVSNLEWMTQVDNVRHAHSLGARIYTAPKPKVVVFKQRGAPKKYTQELIQSIKAAYEETKNFAEVGRRLGICRKYANYLYKKAS